MSVRGYEKVAYLTLKEQIKSKNNIYTVESVISIRFVLIKIKRQLRVKEGEGK